MATTYKTPGVYVEEISNFPPSVAQVETAIPAFIGYTEIAEKDGEDLTNIPTRITSLLEYEKYFGKALNESGIVVSIEDTVDSGAPTVILNRKLSASIGSTSNFIMYYAMRFYFDNGGGPCYIVSVGDFTGSVSKPTLTLGLAEVEKYDEPTLLVFPDAPAVTVGPYYTLMNEAMTQAQKLGDRFAIIDTHGDDSATVRSSTTLGNGTDLLKYGAVYHPNLKTVYNFQYDEADVNINHNVTDETNTTTTGDFDPTTLEVVGDNSDPALFDLVLYNQLKLEIEKLNVTLPPSSGVAGVYARVDENRGVWKAPANESMNASLQPTQMITHEQQEDLNVHTSGKSINAIRSFAGKGILVWGARTLAGNDNEWRYVPVRRFFNMVEESVGKAVEQFVFEPNDANTWVKVRAMIENFLTLQWRDGALAGSKAEQAFFVRVGLGETMTADDILNGRMIVEIGMAAVRPAEFIILKFSHKMQEA